MNQDLRNKLWRRLAFLIGRLEQRYDQAKKHDQADDEVLAQVLSQALMAEALDRAVSLGIDVRAEVEMVSVPGGHGIDPDGLRR